MNKIRGRGDKTYNNFNKVLSKTQAMVSSGISQVSTEISTFVKSTNSTLKSQKEYYIENWMRAVVGDDDVDNAVGSFLFGGVTDLVDEMTGAFSLKRAEMKVKVNEFFIKRLRLS